MPNEPMFWMGGGGPASVWIFCVSMLLKGPCLALEVSVQEVSNVPSPNRFKPGEVYCANKHLGCLQHGVFVHICGTAVCCVLPVPLTTFSCPALEKGTLCEDDWFPL